MTRGVPVKFPKVLVPNAITGSAIFAGYMSIMSTYQGEYHLAAWLILIACVLDMLDGRVARMMKASTEFGIQFDSLADVVNYGVAPSLLYQQLFFKEGDFVGMAISFLPVFCAAVRLARFNVQSEQTPGYFVGLPTTMGAVFLSSYLIFVHSTFPDYGSPAVAAVLLMMVAVLMVSVVPYDKGNILSPRILMRRRNLTAGVVSIVVFLMFPTVAFFGYVLLYILYGLVRSARRTFLHSKGL